MDERVASVPIESLTDPQRVCLRLVATHHNSKEIALLLGVSPSAIDKRIERAVQILGVPSRFAAARALARFEGTAIPEAETYDRLPSDPIDLPPEPVSAARTGSDEPWWLVRRLLGLSSPGDRVGGGARNTLSGLQRLGVMMAITLFVAIASMVVLDLAVTLTGVIRHDHAADTRPR